MKKNKIFILGLLLLCFWLDAYAQKNQNVPSVALAYTAQYVGYFDSRFSEFYKPFNTNEYPGYSKNIGIELALPIKKNCFVNGGVSFFRNTYIQEVQFDNLVDLELDRIIFIKEIINNYSVQVPLSFQYYFGNTQHRFYLRAGLLLDAHYNRNFLKSVHYANGRLEEEIRFTNFRINENILLAGILGMGGELEFNKNFKLFLEEENRIGLNSARVDHYQKKRFDLGVRVGLRFAWKDWNR